MSVNASGFWAGLLIGVVMGGVAFHQSKPPEETGFWIDNQEAERLSTNVGSKSLEIHLRMDRTVRLDQIDSSRGHLIFVVQEKETDDDDGC